ncbi:MAG TPA: transposase [Nitrososphaerales archaeon]|nr:transposase [Nitrososphaerales archaeon]
MKTFRFRLYPNHRQERKMLRMIDTSRRLWNDALAHRRRRWQENGESTPYNLQQWILTRERHSDPLLGELYSQSAQDTLHRLAHAFEAFFARRAGYPKFKKFSQRGSFTYPQAYNGSVKLDTRRRRLFLSKVGNVPIILHRPITSGARLKTCTVVREPSGRWFASLVFEEVIPLQDLIVPVSWSSSVGVDLGLKSLVTLSDGTKVEHPHYLRKSEKRLKHLNRNLSRKQMGSHNREKARKRLAIEHSKVANQRKDHNHKLSTRLLADNKLVVFEDLRVSNMVLNQRLAKSIYDAGWAQLVKFAEYKAKAAGGLVLRVPAAYSTQECWFCGELNQLSLDVRESECMGCCRWLDRDINAARVVLKRGIAKVGQDMPELKPVETRPLLLQRTGEASLVKDAGSTRHEIGAGTSRPRS